MVVCALPVASALWTLTHRAVEASTVLMQCPVLAMCCRLLARPRLLERRATLACLPLLWRRRLQLLGLPSMQALRRRSLQLGARS